MRQHGWSGDLPDSDDEAVRRILLATRACIDRDGPDVGIAAVARELGVTRQTVYRYFPSTDDLLVATAVDAAAAFLDRVERHLERHVGRRRLGPDVVVVEAVAFVVEQLPQEPYVGVLFAPVRAGAFSWGITSEPALTLGRALVERFPVDWVAHGYGDDELDELVEHMLRTTQSFIIDPGTPPRTDAELRAYLTRWLGTAVASRAAATAVTPPRRRPAARLSHR